MTQSIEAKGMAGVEPIPQLTSLPSEVLYEILRYLTRGSIDFSRGAHSDNRSPYLFGTNRHISQTYGAFDDVIALSNTCVFFRTMLAPLIFYYVSLVRLNEVDTVLANPRGFELFSDSKTYERLFMKEILYTSLYECSKADLAKASFKPGVAGELPLLSRYRSTLSACNFVTVLECGNDFLKSGDLKYFPQLKCLKVLDIGVTVPTLVVQEEKSSKEYPRPEVLSISLNTLVNVNGMFGLLSSVKRLDLFCDFNQMELSQSFEYFCELAKNEAFEPLEELNFFVNDPSCFLYTSVIKLIQILPETFPNIASLHVRLSDRNSNLSADRTQWSVQQTDLFDLIKIFGKLRCLQHFGTDINIVAPLSANAFNLKNEEVPSGDVSNLKDEKVGDASHGSKFVITLTDKAADRLRDRVFSLLELLIRFTKATHVHYMYGQTIEQASVYAYQNMVHLIESLASACVTGEEKKSNAYTGVRAISIERGWSPIEQGEQRCFLEKSVDEYFSKPVNKYFRKIAKGNLAAASTFSLPATFQPNPLYRKREYHTITYKHNSRPTTDESPYSSEIEATEVQEDNGSYDSSLTYWSTESSLREMEQYCLKPKPLSSLWS